MHLESHGFFIAPNINLLYNPIMSSSKFAAHKAAKKLLSSLLEMAKPTSHKTVFDNSSYDTLADFNRTIKRLCENDLISIKEVGDDCVIVLERAGKEIALRYSIDNMEIKKPEKWDGKWRIVIFDIPHENKAAREILRNKLKQIGFMAIQKSVYAHPFPCENEIEFIRSVYEIRPYITIITADKIEHEKIMKNHFNLK